MTEQEEILLLKQENLKLKEELEQLKNSMVIPMETKYNLLFKEMNNGFAILDVKRKKTVITGYKISDHNKLFLEIFNIDYQDIINIDIFSVIKQKTLFKKNLSKLIEQKQSFVKFHYFDTDLKKYLNVSLFIFIKDKIALVVSDLTQQIRLSQQSSNSSYLFKEALKVSTLGTWHYDSTKNEFLLSAEALKNLVPPDILYFKFSHFLYRISRKDLPNFITSIRNFAKTNVIDIIVKYNKTINDTKYLHIKSISLPFDQEKNPTMVYGFIQDISHIKLAEEKYRKSEKTRDIILDHINHKVIYFDKDFNILWKNTLAENTYTELSTMVNGKPNKLFKELPIQKQILENVLSSGKREVLELYHKGKYLEIIIEPIIDDNGITESLIYFELDKTENKRKEQILEESEKLYKTLINSAHDRIVLFDKHRNIVIANDAFFTTIGYQRDEYLELKKNYKKFCEGDTVLKNLFTSNNHSTIPTEYEYHISHREGHFLVMQSKNVILTDEAGKLKWVLSVIRDNTAKKEAENKLKNQQKLLETIIRKMPIGLWAK
ncbi:MAG: PAS domain-containing protein, partial [Bacteroidales bacterium]